MNRSGAESGKGKTKRRARAPEPRRRKKRGAWAGSEIWPIEEIRPYPGNPRTHPEEQVKFLADILKRVGPDQPIVVDENGEILKGHGRRLAAIRAGLKSFPVYQRFGLTPNEKFEMRVSDNQSGLMSGWDHELLRVGIEQLKLADYDTGLLGFGAKQLVQFETVPMPPAEFQEFGENIAVEHECPKCGYRWSGSSAPKPEAPAKDKAKSRAEK